MGELTPSAGRVSAGLLFAAVAATTTAVAVAAIAIAATPGTSVGMTGQMAFEGIVLAYLFGIPFALAHTVLLGLPTYLALRRHWPLRLWNAALGGFIIGAVPMTLMTLPQAAAPSGDPFGVNPWTTFLWAVALAGGCGLVGGLVFWLTVRPRP